MAERCIALLEVRPGERVLEVGFGPGVDIDPLTRAGSGCVVGIDAARSMAVSA